MERMDELIKQINQLAHKAKTVGLTKEEEAERTELRQEYIKLFREGFKKNYIDQMYIVDENGNKVKVKKVK